MDPGTTVLVIAWENAWAADIAAEVRELDGQLLVMERLPREDIEVALAAISSSGSSESKESNESNESDESNEEGS